MAIVLPTGAARSQAANGFAATLGVNTAVANGATIKPDTVFKDTDGFYSVATGIATIPAGLGGLYVVSFYLEANTAAVTAAQVKLVVSGAFDNAIVAASQLSANVWNGAGAVVAYLSAGNTVKGNLQSAGTDPLTLVANQTGFGLAFLGSA